MKRIGLTQRVVVVPEHGERRDSLDQRWTGLMDGLGCQVIPLPNAIEDVATYSRDLGIEGFILTGGDDVYEYSQPGTGAPERDRIEHQIIDFCATGKVPLLGVCRGLQALVNHFGGSLSPIDGHVQTRHSVELDPEWMAVPDGRIEVNSFHNMAIKTDDLPGQLTAVAWSEDGTIEAVVHSEYRINGIMWHPEREVMPSALDVALINKLFVPER